MRSRNGRSIKIADREQPTSRESGKYVNKEGELLIAFGFWCIRGNARALQANALHMLHKARSLREGSGAEGSFRVKEGGVQCER